MASTIKNNFSFSHTFIVGIATLSLMVMGCAQTNIAPYRPVVDEPPSEELNQNLYDCQTLATHYNAEDLGAENELSSGILTGALTGVVIGASKDGYGGGHYRRGHGHGGGGEDILVGALIGAFLGGLFGSVSASAEQAEAIRDGRANIVRNCMRGRGHNVIG